MEQPVSLMEEEATFVDLCSSGDEAAIAKAGPIDLESDPVVVVSDSEVNDGSGATVDLPSTFRNLQSVDEPVVLGSSSPIQEVPIANIFARNNVESRSYGAYPNPMQLSTGYSSVPPYSTYSPFNQPISQPGGQGGPSHVGNWRNLFQNGLSPDFQDRLAALGNYPQTGYRMLNGEFPYDPYGTMFPSPRGLTTRSKKRSAPERGLGAVFKKPQPSETEMSPEECQKVYKLLLKAIDGKHDAKNQVAPPEQLNITLLPHQKIGFSWMIGMEKSTMKGGLLSDDMGLGKTVQTIATICKQKKDRQDRAMTLLVAPLALLHQWKAEIESKVNDNYLRAYIYHGNTKCATVQKIRSLDVVLTTYATLAGEFKSLLRSRENDDNSYKGALFTVTWNRIVLDEAHTIKNRRTKASLACVQLKSKFRWCLTGTPIQNSIDDLFAIVSFLRIRPYCEWAEFRSNLSISKKELNTEEKFLKVRKLLEAISLRRCKDTTVDGQPILKLPPREVVEEHVDFTEEERAFYNHLETSAQDKVRKLKDTGKLRSNYFNVLVLLLRLRQACIHPRLTLTAPEFLEEEEALAAAAATSTSPQFETFNIGLAAFKRLVESDPADDECPICAEKCSDLMALSPCGHLMCSPCYENVQKSSSAYLCPTCRGTLKLNLLVPLAEIRANNPRVEIVVPEEGSDDDDEELTEEQLSNRLVMSPTSSKIEKMIELLRQFRHEAPGDKTIVFTQFTSLFKIVIPALSDHGFRPMVYEGSMGIDERADAIKKFFDDPSHSVLLLSLRCGSVGLNLTVANRVIFLDQWWNPSIENQAIDRVHRIGQNQTVKVYKILVPQTVEDRILALQAKKSEIFQNAFGAGGAISNQARLSVGELMSLFHINPDDD